MLAPLRVDAGAERGDDALPQALVLLAGEPPRGAAGMHARPM